jgi:FkbM family methyltransferase
MPREGTDDFANFGSFLRNCMQTQVTPRYDRLRFPNALPKWGSLDMFRVLSFLRANRAELNETTKLLFDQESKELLFRILAYRAIGGQHVLLPSASYDPSTSQASARHHLISSETFDPFKTQLFEVDGAIIEAWDLNIWASFFERQYFFKRGGFQVEPELGDVVIDAGGCFGDTALAFSHAVGPEGRVASFEPMPRQRAVFERNLARNPELAARISIYPFALSDRTRVIPFEDEGAGAQSSQTGSVTVAAHSIDEFVMENKISPTFIKMDIEGAEKDALRGAIKTISEFRPKLAISAYHSLGDLIGLAPLIDSICSGYKFFLDHHTSHSEETVLYARFDK